MIERQQTARAKSLSCPASLATSTRLLVAGALGAVGLKVFDFGIDALFAFMSCGLVSYCLVMVAPIRRELGLRR
jgi:hypothetical protein